jgi:hypothetical protein
MLAERRTLAIELRRDGLSYQGIAEVIRQDPRFSDRYSDSTAMEDCHHVLHQLNQKCMTSMADLRELELQRLDMAAFAIADQVKAGHLGAIDRWIRSIDQRCKLLGLNQDDLNKAWGTLEAYGYERVELGDGGYHLIDKYQQNKGNSDNFTKVINS